MDPELFSCAAQRWTPRIGDPSVMGWVTVVAYAVAFASAGWVAARARRGAVQPHPRRQLAFWLGVAALYGLLAVNKQLDLQSAMTAVGRCLAIRDAWYEDRKVVQIAFILGLAGLAAAAVSLAAWRFRRILAGNRLAFLGVMVTTVFVLVRAVGFHGVDALIDRRVAGLRLNWILELLGIALVTASALLRVSKR